MNAIVQLITSHSLFFLLSIGTIFSFTIMYKWRTELKLTWYSAIIFSVLHTIWGVICVSVFAVIETGFNMEYLGNMSLFGGVFMMPIFYLALAKLTKVPVRRVFDICTNCMLFTLMCARTNCIISNCCFGLKIKGTNWRWPTRELEIIFYIILIILIFRKLQDKKYDGSIYPMYMVAYGLFRFLTEGFRFYAGNSLIHRGHIWSLISMGIGFSVYTEIALIKKKAGGKR